MIRGPVSVCLMGMIIECWAVRLGVMPDRLLLSYFGGAFFCARGRSGGVQLRRLCKVVIAGGVGLPLGYYR